MRECKFNNCTIYIFRAEIPKMSHHIIIGRIIFCFAIDKGLIIPFRKSSRNLFSQIDILRLKYINKLLIDDGLNIAGNVKFMALLKTTLILSYSLKLSCHNCAAPVSDAETLLSRNLAVH